MLLPWKISVDSLITFLVGSILAFAYVTPFLLVFVNSVKLKPEILENPLSLPVSITWENFQEVFVGRKLDNALRALGLAFPADIGRDVENAGVRFYFHALAFNGEVSSGDLTVREYSGGTG